MDNLILSQDNFIIYLDKFYYDVRKVNVILLPFEMILFKWVLKLLINSNRGQYLVKAEETEDRTSQPAPW